MTGPSGTSVPINGPVLSIVHGYQLVAEVTRKGSGNNENEHL
jgi:hypothetical protein